MRIPTCFLCYKLLGDKPDGSFDGGFVKFAEYVNLNEGVEPEDLVFDEPPGFEWFCGEHLAAAEALSHLTSKEALIQLEQQFGKFEEPTPEPEPGPPRTKWQRFCNWFWEHLV
jgi:hypothetical protein